MKARLFDLKKWLTLTLALMTIAAGTATAEDLLVYTALEDDEIPRYMALFEKAHLDIDVKIVRDSTSRKCCSPFRRPY